MVKNKKTILPKQFSSLESAAEFWDTHDLTDYWKHMKPAKFDIRIAAHPRYVAVEAKLARKLAVVARKRKIAPETLVNLWLAERLSKVA